LRNWRVKGHGFGGVKELKKKLFKFIFKNPLRIKKFHLPLHSQSRKARDGKRKNDRMGVDFWKVRKGFKSLKESPKIK